MDRDGDFNDLDKMIGRPYPLPGKAAFNRESGRLSVEVAEHQM